MRVCNTAFKFTLKLRNKKKKISYYKNCNPRNILQVLEPHFTQS